MELPEMQELSCVASRRADMQNSWPTCRVSGPRCKNKQIYCFVLFTIYYSRNLDFLHRGPPTLNVGQQIYCFFTIYNLERRARFFCIAGSRPRRTARMAPLLFTLYYSLWKISRNLDFLHRGPPTLNVGQQIYCFFYYLLYQYLLFRTESEIFFASRAADPEERPEWPPSVYSVLFPMENLPKPRFFASRATNPECRPADLLFFLLFTIYYLERRARIPCIAGSRPRGTARMAPFSLLCTIHGLSGPLLFTLYYSLWKISRNLDFLHRGPPTLNVGQQIYCVFYYFLFTIYYLLFTIYYLLFTIYYLLFTIYYLLFRTESEIFFASRAADPEERPEWHPFCLLCTIPYGKFRETWIFCIAGHQP